MENMSCVSNVDVIEYDLSIVGNSFCPATHDQVDVITSLGFASDSWELYQRANFNSLY